MKPYDDVMIIRAKYRAIKAMQPSCAIIEIVPGVELVLVCNRSAQGGKPKRRAA